LEAAKDCASSPQLSRLGWLLSQIDSELLQDSKPISDLLMKEEKFVWNAECDEAFQTRKKLLTTSPVLAQLDIASLSMFTVMHLALGLDVFSCKKVV
jgi:hypothetical protein